MTRTGSPISTSTSTEHITERITTFIREDILGGDQDQELQATTPLLEWGIINSFNTFRLVSFIREQLGVVVPVIEINPANFGTIAGITAMVARLDTTEADSSRQATGAPERA